MLQFMLYKNHNFVEMLHVYKNMTFGNKIKKKTFLKKNIFFQFSPAQKTASYLFITLYVLSERTLIQYPFLLDKIN